MDNKNVLCRKCLHMIPRSSVGGDYIRQDNSIKKCKVCIWKDHHTDKLFYDGFTEHEIDTFLRFFILNDGIYLNDIARILNKSIDDMIELFRHLRIANHKCMITTSCDNCGKVFDCTMANYSSSKNHYCCFDCYISDKPNNVDKGEQNQFYKKVKVSCDNCGKEISVIPSKIKIQNKFGESHNFCSHDCYSKFRSKYYIGDKSSNYQREFSDVQRKNMSISCSASMSLRTKLYSSVHQKINNFLSENSIAFQSEYSIKYYSIDTYLLDYHLGIEIMGDYWHCNPIIYCINGRKINKIQEKDIIRDKKKNTYITNHYNIPILYIWESDINNRFDICAALICLFICQNGILNNYNSFNWSMDNNHQLVLNESIIYPYFELHKSYYKEILLA